MGRSKTDQLFRREIRALFFKWRMPELGRHSDILSRSTNPVILKARAAIEGGPETLAAVVSGGDILLQGILDQANAHEPPPGIVKIYEKTVERARSLAEGIWPDGKPVMVAPALDTFGEYGKSPHHTCQPFFDVRGTRRGPEKGKLWAGHAWRQIKVGKEVMYCEACYCKRVTRHVEQVIEELRHYPAYEEPPVVYAIMPDESIQRLIKAKQMQRTRSGDDFRYKVYPQPGDKSVIVHNQQGGIPLPTTRLELFDLLYEWCRTPELRRIDGSTGFGRDYQGDKGDGRKKGGRAVDADAIATEDEEIVIRGVNHARMKHAAHKAGLLQADGKRFRQRGSFTFKPDVTWPMYVKVLEDAGINWKVTQGAELLKQLLAEECSDLSTVLVSSPDTVRKSPPPATASPEKQRDKTPFDAVFGAQPT
jgi:hypothetical protein